MNILAQIAADVVAGVQTLYGQETPADKVALSPTRKEFEGDYTVVVFPYTKAAKKKPADIIRANRDFSPWFLHRNNYNAQGVNYGDNITDSVKFLTS